MPIILQKVIFLQNQRYDTLITSKETLCNQNNAYEELFINKLNSNGTLLTMIRVYSSQKIYFGFFL